MESASINMGTKQSQPKQAEPNDKVSYIYSASAA